MPPRKKARITAKINPQERDVRSEILFLVNQRAIPENKLKNKPTRIQTKLFQDRLSAAIKPAAKEIVVQITGIIIPPIS